MRCPLAALLQGHKLKNPCRSAAQHWRRIYPPDQYNFHQTAAPVRRDPT